MKRSNGSLGLAAFAVWVLAAFSAAASEYPAPKEGTRVARDFGPSAGLERIQATVLAINSADDERNPTELGVVDCEIKRGDVLQSAPRLAN